MNKTENIRIIEDQLDNAMKMARIAVENGDMTKDEMARYIPEKANEIFIRVFEASDDEFALMLLGDIMDKLPSILERMKGDDDYEV